MALEQLEPSPLEIQIAIKRGMLDDCPFCGSYPLMHSSVNHETLSGDTLYQARITCTNYRCNAKVICNERSLEDAQRGVIEQWSKRAQPPADEHALDHPIGWKISYTDAEGVRQSVLCGHNSVGDYRDIDPMASSIALGPFLTPPQQDADKADAPTDADVAKLADHWGVSSDGRGIKAHTNIMGFVRDLLASYGQPAQPDPAMAGDAALLDMLETLCNGLEWNIENHPEVMNESDAEALAQARALLKRVQPASGEDAKPDMFWNADDPEQCQDSIHNLLVEMQGNRFFYVGDIVEVQQAVKLPNISVRITSAEDDEGNGDMEYEVVDAAMPKEPRP